MKVLILLFFLSVIYTQNVISRNEKVTEMINELKENQQMYTELITQVETKINKDYESCINETKNQNCSDSDVWQQQRSKSSKNITNLQEKIHKHNKTIDAILQLNKHEVTKQNLTMAQLFPKVEKVKNDIELIENMMFLIEDTYLNLDTAGKSILLLFNHQFQHPKAQQMQKSFIQLMNQRQNEEAPAAEPAAAEESEEQQQPEQTEEAAESPEQTEQPADSSESKPEQSPLIDDEIFSSEIDNNDIEVANLFAPNTETKKHLLAEKIPEGVNVAEHDLNAYEDAAINTEDTEGNEAKEDNFEDLRIYEVQEEFKNTIKEQGKQMHDELQIVLKGLNNELDQLTQSIADLEKAIMDLHHKHAKQIVQIYIETKRLQSQIFQLDDGILNLDARIFDCQNSNQKLELCETRKGVDQIFLDDLKTEQSFNQGIIKEMEKLVQFEDKHVYEPEPMEPIQNIQADIEPQSEEQASNDKQNQEIQERIASIKEEEKLVEQQLQEQSKQEQLEALEKEQPEHLNEVPEIQQENAQQQINKEESPEVNKEEDKVLAEAEKEIRAEEEGNGKILLVYQWYKEGEQPQQEQINEQPEIPVEEEQQPEAPVEEEQINEQQQPALEEAIEEPKLQFLKKNKKNKLNE